MQAMQAGDEGTAFRWGASVCWWERGVTRKISQVGLRCTTSLVRSLVMSLPAVMRTPTLAWLAVLRMYVSVKSLSVRCDAGMWPCYMVARRLRAEKMSEELSRLLRKLSDKGVKYAVRMLAGEEQAR
jgi:hypothetical protein